MCSLDIIEYFSYCSKHFQQVGRQPSGLQFSILDLVQVSAEGSCHSIGIRNRVIGILYENQLFTKCFFN